MRIAIVPTPDLACETGSTTYCVGLVTALVERGHDVVVPCRTLPPNPAAGRYVPVDVPLEHPVFIDRPVSNGQLWHSLEALARTLIDLAEESPFDVVHAFYASFTGAAAAAAGWLTGTPYVVSAFGRDLTLAVDSDPRYRMLATAAVRHAASVVVTTVELRSRVESLGVDPEKVAVVPMGVDERRFAGVGAGRWDESQPQLATVASSFTPEKGVDLVLEALPHVLSVRPEARLLVAGEDDHPSRANDRRLHDLARSLGVEHAVTFLGRVRHEAMPDLLAEATILVDARTAGNFSSSLLEAAVTGVPVVCSEVANNAGVVADGVSGRVVQNGDASVLGRELELILTDSERWHSLQDGAAARRRMLLERFGLRETTRDHEAIYRAALDSRPGSCR